MRTRKAVDEERCKICHGVYPTESGQIADVYLLDKETEEQKFLGYFCEFCRPPSAYLYRFSYVVDRMG